MEEEEKITLTEEQAETFVKEFCQGDIFGLEYLANIINEIKPKRKDKSEDIYDVLTFTINLNTMVVQGETFEGVCSEYHEDIFELYSKMETYLLDMFTNDFEKYFKKYRW